MGDEWGKLPIYFYHRFYCNFHMKTQMYIDGDSSGSEMNIQWYLRSQQSPNEFYGWSFALGGLRNRDRKPTGLGRFYLRYGGPVGGSGARVVDLDKGETNDGISSAGPILAPAARNKWLNIEFVASGDTVEMIADGERFKSTGC